MAGKTIRIKSDSGRGVTPIRINGIGRDIPHNQDIAVTDAELGVLKDSHTAYEVVGNAKVACGKNSATKKAAAKNV